MVDTIVSSLISGLVAVIVCIITNTINSKKAIAIMEYKLDELFKKVNEFNDVTKRVYEIEKLVAVLMAERREQ